MSESYFAYASRLAADLRIHGGSSHARKMGQNLLEVLRTYFVAFDCGCCLYEDELVQAYAKHLEMLTTRHPRHAMQPPRDGFIVYLARPAAKDAVWEIFNRLTRTVFQNRFLEGTRADLGILLCRIHPTCLPEKAILEAEQIDRTITVPHEPLRPRVVFWGDEPWDDVSIQREIAETNVEEMQERESLYNGTDDEWEWRQSVKQRTSRTFTVQADYDEGKRLSSKTKPLLIS